MDQPKSNPSGNPSPVVPDRPRLPILEVTDPPMQNPVVRVVKRELNRWGHAMPPVALDSYYTPDVARGVVALQLVYGLPPTGIVDAVTWDLVLRLRKKG